MELPTLLQDRQTVVDRLERLIRERTGGLIRGLRVEVLPGQVIVSGRANTYYLKQLATHAALEAAENLEFTNAIEVN
jgi:hypothetical protein